MQKSLNILDTTWRNQPTINVDEVRNIPFVADPTPGPPVPVPGSIRGYVSDYPAVLVCEMSDGTKRLVVTSRGVPTGTYDGSANVDMFLDPSPTPFGTTVEQPPSVPFDFYNYEGVADDYPFEPILAELLFTSYEYDHEVGLATWSASLFANGVNLNFGESWVIQDVIVVEVAADFE